MRTMLCAIFLIGCREDAADYLDGSPYGNTAASSDGADDGSDGVAVDGGADTGLRLEAVRIEPSTFEMGCTAAQEDECWEEYEAPAHRVTLTHAYLIDATEVTRTEYARLMDGAWPSGISCGGDCPVDTVSWDMAAAYANARSVEDGLTPFYDCSGSDASRICSETSSPYSAEGWRLPTNAEWEGAARCGTDLKYAGSDEIGEVAWTLGNSHYHPHPVAMQNPNGCGLYDMSGNVGEWVNDFYKGYSEDDEEDPAGPVTAGMRTLRLGFWLYEATYSRVSARGGIFQNHKNWHTGFRLARTLP